MNENERRKNEKQSQAIGLVSLAFAFIAIALLYLAVATSGITPMQFLETTRGLPLLMSAGLFLLGFIAGVTAHQKELSVMFLIVGLLVGGTFLF